MFPADANFSNSVASIRRKIWTSYALPKEAPRAPAAAECNVNEFCTSVTRKSPARPPRPLILSPPPPPASLLK